MAHDVFISHSSKDKAIADAVCASLEADKIRCWIAPRDIHSGEIWAEAITSAIKNCRIMVLLFTKSSNQSKQVARELTLAVNSEVIVAPFKIDDILPSGLMEFYLSDTHWLDAMNPPTQKHIQNLVETVRHTLGEKITAPKSLQDIDKPAPVFFPEKPPDKGKPYHAMSKKTGLIAAAVLACGLFLFGGLYFAGLLPGVTESEDKKTGVEEDDTNVVAMEEEVAVEEEKIIVTSTEDSGEGTLRWALQTARSGDVITFDSDVFPPDNPATIYVKSDLPVIVQGHITVDASNAGVILDGSHGDESIDFGINIQSSYNVIMGLQVLNFKTPGPGIEMYGKSARHNTIGGDRSVGAGPIGQGNLLSGNNSGIGMNGGASENIVTGNLIGTDISGKAPNEHDGNIKIGVNLNEGASNNIIGPDNIIAFYSHSGIFMQDNPTQGNTITQNIIYSNGEMDIYLMDGSNTGLASPTIIDVNLDNGTVRGTASPRCTIEIFSSSESGGKIYEGATDADENGRFLFSKGSPLWGPNVSATATDPNGNTSEFSIPFSR